MPIREDQLLVWSEQKGSAVPQQTYEEIRNMLTSERSHIHKRNFEIFLQGSCVNDTNIHENCDADVVVQLNETLDEGGSPLELFPRFRQEVLNTLQDFFGPERIIVGKRALKLTSESGDEVADILPCCRYRKGIQFLTSEGTPEIRFPKLNHQNGLSKDLRTNGNYKKMIRIFKNARVHFQNQKLSRKRAGSSYSIECLLYNVPDHKFYRPYQQSYVDVIVWLQQADLSQFVCQHEQHGLFGPAPEQWEIRKAQKLIRAYAELWQQWSTVASR